MMFTQIFSILVIVLVFLVVRFFVGPLFYPVKFSESWLEKDLNSRGLIYKGKKLISKRQLKGLNSEDDKNPLYNGLFMKTTYYEIEAITQDGDKRSVYLKWYSSYGLFSKSKGYWESKQF